MAGPLEPGSCGARAATGQCYGVALISISGWYGAQQPASRRHPRCRPRRRRRSSRRTGTLQGPAVGRRASGPRSRGLIIRRRERLWARGNNITTNLTPGDTDCRPAVGGQLRPAVALRPAATEAIAGASVRSSCGPRSAARMCPRPSSTNVVAVRRCRSRCRPCLRRRAGPGTSSAWRAMNDLAPDSASLQSTPTMRPAPAGLREKRSKRGRLALARAAPARPEGDERGAPCALGEQARRASPARRPMCSRGSAAAPNRARAARRQPEHGQRGDREQRPPRSGKSSRSRAPSARPQLGGEQRHVVGDFRRLERRRVDRRRACRTR